MTDEFEKRLQAINDRQTAKRDKHRVDVEYVKANHPDVAELLTEFAKAFGRDGFRYRVTIKDF